MKIALDRSLVLGLVVACAMCGTIPAAPAQQNRKLEKHARKIEKKLSKFHPGSYVQIDFRNNSESLGSLGALSDATFQVTNADNNKAETYAYSDVAQVRKGNEYIGQGSEPGRRFHVPLPVLIVAGAVAAGAATYLAVR
jgi:hypothetical protein